jgi:sugar O-acyltransferase (sialic acid O-acetyltransferase NeuD family)
MPGPRLAIIGGGGFAKEVAEVARLCGYDITGCYAQDPGSFAPLHRGYLDDLLQHRADYEGVVLGVGGVDRRSLTRRRGLTDWLANSSLACPPLVSPHAIRAEGVETQAGCFVAHGAILGLDAVLKDFCVINSGAIIGHDAIIGTNSTIAPGAFIGGAAEIGTDTLIGPLAKVLHGVKIGDDVIVGLGCAAFRALAAGSTVWPRPDRTT